MSSNACLVFSRTRARRALTIVTVVLSVLYPGFVYFGHDRFSPLAFVSAVVVLTFVRIYVSGSIELARWRGPDLISGETRAPVGPCVHAHRGTQRGASQCGVPSRRRLRDSSLSA